MLVLMCEAAGNRFAVDARQVVEVVARVRLQPVPSCPDWLAGISVYRGQMTPVLDLSYLVAAKASPVRWSNRIVMVRVAEEASAQICGLIVVKVTVAEVASEPVPAAATGMSPWGPVRLDGDGMFQLLELPRIFSGQRRQALGIN